LGTAASARARFASIAAGNRKVRKSKKAKIRGTKR
jgi:hypothetical protein